MMELKTKFNPGDEVWAMHQNKPRKFRISAIEIYLYAPGTPMVRRHQEIYVEAVNDPNKRNNPQHLRYGADECFATMEDLKNHLFNV